MGMNGGGGRTMDENAGPARETECVMEQNVSRQIVSMIGQKRDVIYFSSVIIVEFNRFSPFDDWHDRCVLYF
ncbi:MAG: hypothetical protein HQL76_05255 [Magnetococcales bacterium]|nr:hypothetical protein [Magnetococcales bacterium]